MNPTRTLAEWLATTCWQDWPTEVRHEAVRSLVNWLGCAIGGAPHPGTQAARRAMRAVEGAPVAVLLGLRERSDMMTAALVNGISSHVLDFDDTHATAFIHPSAPVLPAVLALAEARGLSGAAALEAFVLGVEAACRIGNSVLPSHYEIGWHITGTAGSIGAAAACARLLGLDAERMVWAIGLGATQPVGIREHFGSMTKSFHPGRAAQNGLLAALLAEQGFDAAEEPIAGRRGFAAILAQGFDAVQMTEALGGRWEILRNTYKPFACGLVIHPAIDAALQLHAMPGFDLAAVESLALMVHPIVMELTGKREPASGLEGKFSVYHAAAVALVDGAGGEAQFSDARVTAPEVVALRHCVSATVEPALHREACTAVLTLRGGRQLRAEVTMPLGSLGKPMSDAMLAEKFTALAAPVLGETATERLLDASWKLAEAPNLGFLATYA
jgi:2-methylcitrate dehydratase PrpD